MTQSTAPELPALAFCTELWVLLVDVVLEIKEDLLLL